MSKAQETERKKLAEKPEEAEGKANVFRVVKQMVAKNKDGVGDGCIKDGDGNVVVQLEGIKEMWRKYFEKVLNKEFVWERNSLKDGYAVCGL